MWNSTTRETDEGKKYDLKELRVLIEYAALVLETEEDAEDLKKDSECDVHYVPFLKGITNGEYFYALFQIFAEMQNPEPSKDAMYKEAVLASVLDGLEEKFFNHFENDGYSAEEAEGVWELYKVCQRDSILWENEEGEPC